MSSLEETARGKCIVALDVDTADEARELVRLTSPFVGVYKVGLQLYMKEGSPLVEWLVDQGVQVFLDLKLHDIPNTILAAARQIARLKVAYFTVHCANGERALTHCRHGLDQFCAEENLTRPTMLGVTVLTSMSETDLRGIGVTGNDVASQVGTLAEQAYAAGLRAFIASAREAADLKRAFPGVMVITPGIRPAGSSVGDQARVMTPAQAIRSGADALVIGRPVTRASNPSDAARNILSEIRAALGASNDGTEN
jgi:orotidine-5'-phosphate decarboxylase